MNDAPQRSHGRELAPRSVEPELDLRSFATAVRRQFWTILVTALGIVAVTLLVVSQLQRLYTATTLVVVDSRQSQMLGFEPAVSEVFGLNPAVDTEVEIASSTSVLSRVARDLPIAQSLEYLPEPSIIDRTLWILRLAEKPAATDSVNDFTELSAANQATLLHNLSRRIEVSRLNLTQIIAISADAESPAAAAELANAVTNAYLDEQIEARLTSSQRAVSFLSERVNALASEISSQEEKIDKFVTDTLGEYRTPESNEMLRRLERERERNTQYASNLMELEDAIRTEEYGRVAELLDSADFRQRRENLADLLSKEDIAPTRREAARADLTELDEQIRVAGVRRTAEIRTAIAANEQTQLGIRDQLDAILKQQAIPREVSLELFRLQRDAETQKNLYSSFLTKLRQTEQQAGFDLPDSRVIAPATPPETPSSPPLKIITAAALLFSIFGGVGMAVLREFYVGGFTGIEQLEVAVGVPVIASIPHHKMKDGKGVESAIVADPLSSFSEAIRRARLGVDAYAQAGKLCVVVTSTVPEEGKTTFAIALARAFALTKRKTILIDADLRHPAIGKVTFQPAKYTLAKYLTGEMKEEEVAQLVSKPEAETGLKLILGTEGRTGATDVLLMSERFRKVMSYARTNFEVVVVDTSPVGLVVDPQIIAREADVSVYVVRYASTNQNVVTSSLRRLQPTSRELCAVLNQVERRARLGGYYTYN